MIVRSLIGALLMTVATPALAQPQVVNVAASDPTRPNFQPASVTQTFGPGSYDVTSVGKAGGGLFDAWSVATPAPGNWDGRFDITYGGTTQSVNPYSGQRFATPEAALGAFSGVLASFTLPDVTDVTFSIPDYLWWDNTGGVSLGVSSGSPAAVPEPGMIGLFALGGAAMLAARRRKRANA